jgi:hypothetical protein
MRRFNLRQPWRGLDQWRSLSSPVTDVFDQELVPSALDAVAVRMGSKGEGDANFLDSQAMPDVGGPT